MTASEDASTEKSRTGYVITYSGCPALWNSKLQTHVALSNTEAEHIALSQTLLDAIYIMKLVREMKDRGYNVCSTEPKVT